MKKAISLLFVLILLLCGSSAGADRQVVEKDQFYIGAMRVVRCHSYVSLREAPNKTSKQLAKIEPDEIRVPFTNMVYIGDSETDIPCMKLVNTYGGYSVGVYDPDTGDKRRVLKLLDENRIGYYAPADYREGSELDRLMEGIIRRTAANEALVEIHNRCLEGGTD